MEVRFRIDGAGELNGETLFDELCKAYADGRKVWISFAKDGAVFESNLLTSGQLYEVIETMKGWAAV